MFKLSGLHCSRNMYMTGIYLPGSLYSYEIPTTFLEFHILGTPVESLHEPRPGPFGREALINVCARV